MVTRKIGNNETTRRSSYNYLFLMKNSGAAGDDGAQKKLSTMDQIKMKLKMEQKRIESLESRPLQIASEYYTQQEMSSFKKVKRRVKKTKTKGSQILRADDLLPDTAAGASSSDLGSRSRKNKPDDDLKGNVFGSCLYSRNKTADCFASFTTAPTEDLSSMKLTLDDFNVELKSAMSKAKRMKEKKDQPWSLESIASSIKREPMDQDANDEEDANRNSNIVLNATAEFCRTLGEIPTYGMAGNRDEDEDELMV